MITFFGVAKPSFAVPITEEKYPFLATAVKQEAQKDIQQAAALLKELEQQPIEYLEQLELELAYEAHQQQQMQMQQQDEQERKIEQRRQEKLEERKMITDTMRTLGEFLGGGGSFQPWW